MKILITGAVKAGKTTLASKLAMQMVPVDKLIKNIKADEPPAPVPGEGIIGIPIICTDELIGKMDWSAESEEVAKWLDRPDSFILEGATVVRALRKWLATHPEGKPCDCVIYLTKPREELTKGQLSSCKAQTTMWGQIEKELIARGVKVEVVEEYPVGSGTNG